MTETYRIANKNIQITSLYNEIHVRCMPFRVNAEPDFRIEVTGADIDAQWNRLNHQNKTQRRSAQTYSEAEIETYVVLDKISKAFLSSQNIILHCSAVKTNGEGFLFFSQRSIIRAFFANLWKNCDTSGRSVLLNNNTSMVHVGPEEATVYSIPWNRERTKSVNQSAPIKAACLLESGSHNEMKLLDEHASRDILLEYSVCPMGESARSKRLELIDTLLSGIKLYRFESNMDYEAVQTACGMMSMD